MKTHSIVFAVSTLIAAGAVQAEGIADANAHFAVSHEAGDGPRRTQTDARGAVASGTLSPSAQMALAHFEQDHGTGDGGRTVQGGTMTASTVISTAGSDRTALAAAILDNDERGDN